MKKKLQKQRKNSKIKRKSAGTNKGQRYVMGANGLIPISWYNKSDIQITL